MQWQVAVANPAGAAVVGAAGVGWALRRAYEALKAPVKQLISNIKQRQEDARIIQKGKEYNAKIDSGEVKPALPPGYEYKNGNVVNSAGAITTYKQAWENAQPDPRSQPQQGSAKAPSLAPDETAGEGPKEAHANSLDTTKPAKGYTLRDRDTGDILKYGETTNGPKRYSQTYLDENNADMNFEAAGTKREMHTWQHEKILEHKAKNDGARPPLNKSDY